MHDANTPKSCDLSGAMLFIFRMLINSHQCFTIPISNEIEYPLMEQGPQADRS